MNKEINQNQNIQLTESQLNSLKQGLDELKNNKNILRLYEKDFAWVRTKNLEES
jgi:hypothetical protein